MAAEFTLDDFASQLRLVKGLRYRADPFGELLDYFRSGRAETLAGIEKILDVIEPAERQNSSKIGPMELQRISAASGKGLSEVKSFLAGFDRLRKQMRGLEAMSFFQRIGVAIRGVGPAVLVPWLLVVLLLCALIAR